MKLTKFIREAFVRAVMADVPTVNYQEQARSLVNKKVARLQKIGGVLDIPAERLRNSYFHAVGCSFQLTGITESEQHDLRSSADIAAISKENDAQRAKLNELQSKLTSVIAGCNTRKQAVDALPEFEKYLPPDDPAAIRTLPALANVLSDFVQAGWPKNHKRINPLPVKA